MSAIRIVELRRQKVSIALRCVDAADGKYPLQGRVDLSLWDCHQEPYIHREGFFVFINLPDTYPILENGEIVYLDHLNYEVLADADYYYLDTPITFAAKDGAIYAPDVNGTFHDPLTEALEVPLKRIFAAFSCTNGDAPGEPLPELVVHLTASGDNQICKLYGERYAAINYPATEDVEYDVTVENYTIVDKNNALVYIKLKLKDGAAYYNKQPASENKWYVHDPAVRPIELRLTETGG